jgi:hypothetical protein
MGRRLKRLGRFTAFIVLKENFAYFNLEERETKNR